MKRMRKLFNLVVMVVILITFGTACQNNKGVENTEADRNSTAAESKPEGSTAVGNNETAEVKDTASDMPSFKFGFVHSSFSDQLGIMYQKYAIYAAKALNSEITFAESGSDADLRMSSVENMIQIGCNGIIVSTVTEPMLAACEAAGVYLIQVGNNIVDPDLAAAADANLYFIGSVLVDNFEVGYNMAEAMYNQGCRNVALLKFTPGAVTTMDDRAKGIEAFIDEHSDMKVATTYSGGANTFAEGAEQILAAYPDIDGLISVMANTSIASAIYAFGLADQVKYAGVDIQEGTDELLEAGTMAYVAGGAFPNAEICVAMLYNYLTGYELWENSLENIRRPLVELQSVDDYNDYMNYMEGDLPVYNTEELRTIVGVCNENVTWNDVVALALDSSLESVKERHAGLVD